MFLSIRVFNYYVGLNWFNLFYFFTTKLTKQSDLKTRSCLIKLLKSCRIQLQYSYKSLVDITIDNIILIRSIIYSFTIFFRLLWTCRFFKCHWMYWWHLYSYQETKGKFCFIVLLFFCFPHIRQDKVKRNSL